MRKIYSLVLIAAGLLIGTNSWAADVYEASDLQPAINAGGTVTLQSNIVLEDPIWIGPEDGSEAGAAPSVVLDLNGKTISYTASGTDAYMFVLGKGTLEVKNGNIKLLGTPTISSNVFTVYGTYNNTANYSHLIIDADATVTATNGTAIAVMEKGLKSGKYKGAYGKIFDDPNAKGFLTTYKDASYGFAMGVVVDVKGKLEVSGAASKTYGIKTNGLLSRPVAGMAHRTFNASKPYEAGMANLTVTDAFEANVPYVHVWSTAEITTDAGIEASAAVYASGYAHWLIEGKCEGNIGASISSGEVTFNNATVSSNATSHTSATGDNHVSGSGIGISVNSRNQNEGDINVTITGTTEVTSPNGYAIEEKVNANQTEVESITIESGTFVGGNTGAIAVTEASAGKTTIYGGNISNSGTAAPIQVTNAEGTPVDDQAAAIESILPEGAAGVTPTAQYDSNTGKTTIVFKAGYHVTLNADGLATFSAEETTKIPAGLKVYQAGNMANDALVLDQVDDDYIPANTGVILYGEANQSYSMAIYNDPVAISEDYASNSLKAYTAWESRTAEPVYILHGSELWQYTGTQFVDNKAFLQLPGGANNAPARISMRFNTTTAVENVETEAVKAVKFVGEDGQLYIRRGEAVYSVQGQLVK